MVLSIINNNVPDDVQQLIQNLKQANDGLRKELVLCHDKIRYLEDDILRLKMLLEGKDTIMNSFKTRPDR